MRKKKLTKIEALKICVRLWAWLVKHPTKTKDDWPGWDKYKAQGIYFRADCPCCQYREEHPIRGGMMYHCEERCLIEWPGGRCDHPASPYREWIANMEKQRSTPSAKAVLKLARAALRKHTRKKS